MQIFCHWRGRRRAHQHAEVRKAQHCFCVLPRILPVAKGIFDSGGGICNGPLPCTAKQGVGLPSDFVYLCVAHVVHLDGLMGLPLKARLPSCCWACLLS